MTETLMWLELVLSILCGAAVGLLYLFANAVYEQAVEAEPVAQLGKLAQHLPLFEEGRSPLDAA